MNTKVNLPEKLIPFEDRFLPTLRPFNRILLSKNGKTELWNSKVGGRPYWPEAMAYPKDEKQEDLYFLAQINFAEMPALEGFPENGILQFFINDDDLYGVDFDNPFSQKNFRIIFHEEISKDGLKDDFSFLRTFKYSPLNGNSSSMEFQSMSELVPTSDHQFEQFFGADFFDTFKEQSWDILESYNEAIRSSGHKVGGYADFAQFDPRDPEDNMILLFQLDSDAENDISWGDLGIGNFFIKKEDLENKNFEKILYNWDCT